MQKILSKEENCSFVYYNKNIHSVFFPYLKLFKNNWDKVDELIGKSSKETW